MNDRPFFLILATTLALASAGCKKQAGGPAQMPAPQVIVAQAREQRVTETLSRVANVQANESIEIRAEADGIVEEILFQEGQPVEKGHVLVRLDETKFAANLAQSEANFKLAEANFARSKELFQNNLISQQDFDQASAVFQANSANQEFNRRQLRDARIVAPFSGIMGARRISPGQLITKNTTISYLIDLDPAKIEFDIPERFLGQVRTNQQISVHVEAFPGKEFTGTVFFVSPFVDPTNRTALIKATIPNPDYQLKPGMFANLDLTLTVRDSSIVIPEEAVTQILTNSQALVFAVDDANKAQLRKVTLGVRLVGEVEVRQGLKAGERVIVEGLQKVVPGGPVRIVPAQPAAAPAEGKPSTQS